MRFVLFFVMSLVCLSPLGASLDIIDEPLIHEQDIVSPRYIVSFYRERHTQNYSAFTIVSLENLSNIAMIEHETGSFSYCFPKQVPLTSFTKLEDSFLRIKKGLSLQDPTVMTSDTLAPEIELQAVAYALLESDVVAISFGAGLSSPFVPTLEDFCTSFDLRKIPSTDYMTDDSMSGFIQKLVEAPYECLLQVNAIWQSINACQLQNTPNHLHLKDLIEHLEESKTTFTYTDNIDGIHQKCGINLSRTELTHSSDGDYWVESVIYPEILDLKGKKVVSLIIGQSFDFDSIQSTIYTLAKQHACSFQFILMNMKQTSFKVFDGLVVNQTINEKDLIPVNLPCYLAKGDLQNTLPRLCGFVKRRPDFDKEL